MDRVLGSEDPTDRIHNCQVIHYTRRDPSSGELSAHLDWFRSICPWDSSLCCQEWRTIERRTYTNEELIEMAARYPRLFAV